MAVYVRGDLHGHVVESFSYKQNPELRDLGEDDVIVVCGDIGLGWCGADREYKYMLDFLSAKPFKVLCVRGNHDNTDVIRNNSVPTRGDGKVVKLIAGTLSNPAYEGKVYSNVYWVSDSAILDVCGKRSLVISGAQSHDIWNLVHPSEKERLKRLHRDNRFFRVIGESWWPDEDINIPYAFSLINDYLAVGNSYVENAPYMGDGKRRLGKFAYVFTHDCPVYFTTQYVWPGDIARLRATEGEDFLELIKDHINYRWFIHGHMHTFKRYGVNVDDYGQHEIVCVYKELMRLPDSSDSNFQEWEYICTSPQAV